MRISFPSKYVSLLGQFSLYVHKSGLQPDSFHFLGIMSKIVEITFSSIPLNIEFQYYTPHGRHTVFPQMHDMLAHYLELIDILPFSRLAI